MAAPAATTRPWRWPGSCADTDVTPDHRDHAAAANPGAELLVLDRGSHLAFHTHPDAAKTQARAMEFLG